MRRTPLVPILILAVSAPCLSHGAAAPPPPNFIVIYIDDMGYGDIGPFGATAHRTPHLDTMAAEGMRLTSFYAAPLCTPSRAALMTGCYPRRVGLERGSWHAVIMPGDPHGIHPGETTIAEVLKQAGYATACIGKWHLGDQPEFLPTRNGFDYYYGLPYSNDMSPLHETRWRYPPLPLLRNETVLRAVDDQSDLTAEYTEEAVRFIREHRDGPFFLYLAHTMVHRPLAASKKFLDSSDNGLFGDAVEELDRSTGRILDTVRELGLDESTLVIFASDNGPAVGSAGPLRGRKGSTYEGGMRVPAIAWWPGTVPAGTASDEVMAVIDLLPTFAGLAGSGPDGTRRIDGKNIAPLLLGESGATSPHEAFYYYGGPDLKGVRSGPWKLYLPGGPNDAPVLYNLDDDIGETRDVAQDHPEVVARLRAHLDTARKDIGDGTAFPGEGVRPVGYHDNPKFLIPRPAESGLAPHAPVQDSPVDKSPPPEARNAAPRRNAAAPPNMVLILADDLKDDAPRRPEIKTSGDGPYPDGFSYTTALPHEPGVARRDPSDVVRVDDSYYVWYSKITKGPEVFKYPSGYSADVYYASSREGAVWNERGIAVGKGGPGAWDEHGVFTPNILAAQGKYYLFYTGVPAPFDDSTKTAIGLAVADSPDGPWRKFDNNPILRPSEVPDCFDSMRVDDAALVVRDGMYWLYYKGRQLGHTPGETKMGLAVAAAPEGPYVKHEAGPLHPGHEVMVWPQHAGVASMAISAGPRTVYYADDGIHFTAKHPVPNPPKAPGCYRVDGFQSPPIDSGIRWGIAQQGQEGDIFLMRFDCVFNKSRATTE